MIAVELTFKIQKRGVKRDQEFAVSCLIAALLRNGSLCGTPTFARTRGGWTVNGAAPDRAAFQRKNLGKWGSQRLSESRRMGVAGPHIRIFGPVAEVNATCPCLRPSGYILFTTFLTMGPPVLCLRCGGDVPIYRLPRDEHGELSDLISWESEYRACDTLQMLCEVGERFGTRQISDSSSSLTMAGKSVCKRLEEQTGLRAYYYLHRSGGRSALAEAERTCPGCGGSWRRKKPLHGLFDFKCDKCRLLSNISFDFR